MNLPITPNATATGRASNRRDFLKTAGLAAGAAAITGLGVPAVHAAGSDLIQLGLVGTGGRGTGAATNALRDENGQVKLVAMADVFQDKMDNSVKALSKHKDKFAVPNEHKFIGFDGYKQVMDVLKPGDVVILTTPPAFRWPMFQYAISKGLNVFMEKPVTVDGPTSRRMLKLGEDAQKKNLKVGIGLMIRHCDQRRQLKERIDKGEIGDIVFMRAYRMGGGGGFAGPKPKDLTDLQYQIRRFHGFLWASGGVFSDYNIHQIDECSWMKGSFPVKAHAIGGRHYRGNNVDQNFDTYSIEYTFADGTKFFFEGRQMPGCENAFNSFVHGTKGIGIVSTNSHVPGNCRIWKGYNMTKEDLLWTAPQTRNPYDIEWNDLIEAIRQDKPYNEVKRGVEASLVTAMGRMAAHTGRETTYEQAFNSEHEFAPNVDKIDSKDFPAPLQPGPDGTYPVPMPGMKGRKEY